MDRFHAIADPTRRRIIEILAEQGQQSATQIADQFPVSPPAISQHLKILREARWVQVEKRAQQRIYHINPEATLELEDWARKLRSLWDERFAAIDQLLIREKMRSKGDD